MRALGYLPFLQSAISPLPLCYPDTQKSGGDVGKLSERARRACGNLERIDGGIPNAKASHCPSYPAYHRLQGSVGLSEVGVQLQVRSKSRKMRSIGRHQCAAEGFVLHPDESGATILVARTVHGNMTRGAAGRIQS